jgi:TonB family protein
VEALGRRAREKQPEEIRYDTPPKPRGVVRPVYPYRFLREGTTGKATVLFQISPQGEVVGVKIAEATHPEFGLALAAAAETFQFDPALKDGKPTQTVLKLEQEFTLSLRDGVLSDGDQSLLRRERKKPETIIGADKLDAPTKPLSRRSPLFPLALLKKVEQGTATIELLIDAEGHARLPRIVDASDPAFGYAAVQAVSQWLFEPPKVGGRSTVARVRVTFEFEATPPVMGTAVGIPPAADDGK